MENRKEQLYTIMYDAISELTEHESAEDIFDNIVEYFALRVEEARTDVDTYTDMLNVFRKDNPVRDVPEADPYTRPARPDWDKAFGGLDDINKTYMPSNQHIWEEFLKNIKFTDNQDTK